ncbi:hypothetical protein B0T26DRAFT_265651 [Lasiosphaeria miniovina]|uniref:Hydrophobin n=1 Tax=Lasiosphaeria miniovina TaxID=1954250 RepID=A0AA40AJ04_9PEZI|nr:uncharacterized protein B0T26DRAFT_265651 [Lasiosphaeria miniovina]KAK0716761.1 hypothetical protein B0T26DRAFT_265651 [Lasiosphaeria miniovina]
MTPTWTHCARLVGATLLAMCTGIAPANAFAPLERRGSDSSWSPAKQTGLPERDHPNRVGWSPRPTDAPPSQHNYGAMDLLKRDTFSIGSDTCGFLAGYSSAAVTCVKLGAYCTDDGAGNIDCCTGAYSVCKSSMLSACLDFSASLQGACGTGLGPRTLC